jgi:peptidyl-prolyl cis-trans isomerase-like 2
MNSEFVADQCRSIIPYIKKFGKHPVTGALLKQEHLIPLTFHKNSDGELS